MVEAAFLTQFEVAGLEFVGERDRAGHQFRTCLGVVGDDAIGVQVRQADQEAAEQQAFDERERQVADEFALAVGFEGVHLVAQTVAQDGEPARVVAQRRGALGERERLQFLDAARQAVPGRDGDADAGTHTHARLGRFGRRSHL